jgi:aspartate/methionine/tyrosine aminotransferase
LAAGLTEAGYAVLAGPATWFIHVDLAASGIAMSDVAFCERLVREAGVAAIPISAFYAQAPETGYVRFCFTKSPDSLDEALGRLARFRQSLG